MTPSWREMGRTFGRIGLLSFGGPAAQIALMHRELVESRGWLDERRFAAALSFCMLLPGPEAMQLATYCGWRLRGARGGLLAGGLFVLPGAAVIFALAGLYAAHGELPAVRAAFLGVQAAVLAIVVQAVIRLSRRALRTRASVAVAALAFAALFALAIPFPVVIAAAALWGSAAPARPDAPGPAPAPAAGAAAESLRAALLWGAIWLAPLAAIALTGPPILWEVGAFFSRLAVLTFGGAYAVLAWVAQEAVAGRGWLTAEQMIDALGLAEATPGPLILVTQFVGIFAGLPEGRGMAVAAGLVTLHATFAPCFLWIFAGAPWLETITTRPRLRGALDAVTAAVVGVIGNLALWFAAHVLFRTVDEAAFGAVHLLVPSGARPAAFALAAVSAVLLIRLRWPLAAVLAASAAASLALHAGSAPGS